MKQQINNKNDCEKYFDKYDNNYNFKYNDIIDMPHHVSNSHPRMSMEGRAAQFAPFAALTGHKEEVLETQRLTDRRVELDDNSKQLLDKKINAIIKYCEIQPVDKTKEPEIAITYFVQDEKKEGGSYVTVKGIFKKVDYYKKRIVLLDGTAYAINDVVDITSDIFSGME